MTCWGFACRNVTWVHKILEFPSSWSLIAKRQIEFSGALKKIAITIKLIISGFQGQQSLSRQFTIQKLCKYICCSHIITPECLLQNWYAWFLFDWALLFSHICILVCYNCKTLSTSCTKLNNSSVILPWWDGKHADQSGIIAWQCLALGNMLSCLHYLDNDNDQLFGTWPCI